MKIEVTGYLTPSRQVKNHHLIIKNDRAGEFREEFLSKRALSDWLLAEIAAGRQVLVVNARIH
jgi:hypothetical protein